jgi:serine/threonine protein kinase
LTLVVFLTRAMTLAAGTPIGKYVVRRKLAEGGMAEIYLAAVLGPEGFEKDVVIKRVRPGLADDPGFVRMFIAEARVASRLNHANLVHIFDFDKHEDTYYLAMEYVRGHSLWELRRRCQERGVAIPPTLVAQIAMEVARGLAFAHRLTENGRSLGLVHRDVTPHNVLLSFDGMVKLTDFGIAKAGTRATASGVLKGKFAYMAPEQARGDPVDARTDVFALGVTCWELLTGARLFEGDGDVAVLRAVQESLIAPPARLNPDVPAGLDAVVMRALERDPSRRWPTAHEMERALAEFLMGAARSLEDTDVGAFLRRMFPEEAGVAEGAGGTASIPISISTSSVRVAPAGAETVSPAVTSHAALTELHPGEPEPVSTSVLPARVGEASRAARRRARLAWVLGAVVMAAGLSGASWKWGAAWVGRWAAPRLVTGSKPPRPEAQPSLAGKSVVPSGSGSAPSSGGLAAVPTEGIPTIPQPPASVSGSSERSPGEGEGTAASAESAAARSAEPPVRRATLLVRAKPWAEVRIDGGRRSYVQGSKPFSLTPGRHVVELKGNDGQRVRIPVELEAGRTRPLEFPSPTH